MTALKPSGQELYGELARAALHPTVGSVHAKSLPRAWEGGDMRWKQIEKEPKTFALIFETSDEIDSLETICERTGIGRQQL